MRIEGKKAAIAEIERVARAAFDLARRRRHKR